MFLARYFIDISKQEAYRRTRKLIHLALFDDDKFLDSGLLYHRGYEPNHRGYEPIIAGLPKWAPGRTVCQFWRPSCKIWGTTRPWGFKGYSDIFRRIKNFDGIWVYSIEVQKIGYMTSLVFLVRAVRVFLQQ